MRLPLLLCIATVLLATADLKAQRRGRFNRGGGDGNQPSAPAPEAARPERKKPKTHLAIVGGDVYLGTGQRITGATVLCGDDAIVAVGHDLQLPEGTVILDAKGKTVCPGFVCVVGNGMGAGRGSPWVDSVNPFDPEIKQGLAAGITSFLAGAPGGGAVPAGDSAVIKLAWGDVPGMVLKEGTVVGMSAQLGFAERDAFSELVKKAKEHVRALEEHQKKADQARPPQAPPGTEKILAVLNGSARLWLQLGGGGGGGRGRRGGLAASDLEAIRDALQIAAELGVGVVLNKPMSAWLCPDEIAGTGSMVILCPRDRTPPDPADPDHTGTNLAATALLAAAGIPVGVTCPVGGYGGGAGVTTGGILGQDLNTPTLDAAFAVRGGLDDRKALRTMTLDAARILGVDARIGSLEAGKDADILILDGDPMHYRSFVSTAIVNGKVAYEKSKEPFYSHIQR